MNPYSSRAPLEAIDSTSSSKTLSIKSPENKVCPLPPSNSLSGVDFSQKIVDLEDTISHLWTKITGLEQQIASKIHLPSLSQVDSVLHKTDQALIEGKKVAEEVNSASDALNLLNIPEVKAGANATAEIATTAEEVLSFAETGVEKLDSEVEKLEKAGTPITLPEKDLPSGTNIDAPLVIVHPPQP